MTAMAEESVQLKDSTLYQEFFAERAEILKHKWIESEKAGRDIGLECALTDWIVKHRRQWRQWRRSQQAATSRTDRPAVATGDFMAHG